jgi:2-methylcitrate dehydratase PrpD
MTAAEVFAAHALGLTWAGLPESARNCAKIFLLDTIAVGAAGAHAPYAADIIASETGGSHGTARIFASPILTSPRAAAFANAYQIHAQEFDCVHEPAVLHPFSALLGALAAECTARPGIDGATFGAALIAGVDIAVALGVAATSPIRFFRPATAGIFGATAALARLRGFSQAQTVAALGNALAFASGTMQAHVEGTPGLALQVAAAARNALAAADLAEAGLPGAAGAIDGPFGYLPLFETSHDLAPILASLGQSFAVTGLSHKPFPTGRAAHGGIGAVQTLLQTHGVAASTIATLRYDAPALIARLVGRPAQPAMRVAYARLCLPYLAARTAIFGTVRLDAFSHDALADAAVLELAGRITVTVNDNPDPAAFTPAVLHAELRDGQKIEIQVPAVLGNPTLPLDREAQLRKVQDCLTFARLSLPAETLARRIDALDEEPDMAALFALVCPSAESSAHEKSEIAP